MNSPIQLWYDARAQLTEFVMNDLQGVPNAKISGRPLNRMIVGILHPQYSATSDIDLETDGEDQPAIGNAKARVFEESDDETDISLTNLSRPSSMGLTVSIDRKITPSIECHFQATRYHLRESENSDTRSNSSEEWDAETVKKVVNLVIPRDLQSSKKENLFIDDDLGLLVTALSRPVRDGRTRVTVSIVNTNKVQTGELRDSQCWFRPEIILKVDQGCFVDGRPHFEMSNRNPELQELDFLYRNEMNLAIGHGCSPTWPVGGTQVQTVASTFFPTHEILLSSPNAGAPGDPFGEYDLSMMKFAMNDDYGSLDGLERSYLRWILAKERELESELNSLTEGQLEIGRANLAKARDCHTRIVAGIKLLRDDQEGHVSKAFRLMNLAMAKQRGPEAVQTSSKWRPFQMAFILMNLPGLSEPGHKDRDLADLLWFPTGGGKTEAYLGCISFSIFLRRIRYPEDGGVSAIMRYTLRLLTADQFERASRLICAMEVVRREYLPDSKNQISLGMWVGKKTTPNSHNEVQDDLDRRDSSPFQEDEKTLTYQVRKCPHCKTKIPFKNYELSNESLLVKCPNEQCQFKSGLPLFFVDEDVYAQRPSLVIGTVDKFATMAWQPQVAKLLSTDGEALPPDLIVQDEFHLLSGPLGTMVGLYEGAIDLALTTHEGFRPKVLASTATIRQATDQTRAIFNRKAIQFPPAGLSPDDNYFSQAAPPDEMGTRKYVGVIAPGTSQATLLVRLYAALLQGVCELKRPHHATPEEWQIVLDAYWTLLGYFNSLRVLGSASLQANDDIPERVRILADRSESEPRPGLSERTPSELTSRKSSAEIATTRENMGKSYPSEDTPSIVLATNMISVGLDVDRLGLMVVAGQPQNASEYIQATSRVGRRHPGLVFVAFNANRTRDVSHFESFEYFHRTLYSAVEATTATPFSPRARDRGAHGVLVSASRLIFSELRGDNAAGSIAEMESQVLKHVVDPLVRRAEQINGPNSDEASALEKRLKELLDEWVDLAVQEQTKDKTLIYGKQRDPKFGPKAVLDDVLLVQSGAFDGPDRFDEIPPWETLTSLRDVDSETFLTLYE